MRATRQWLVAAVALVAAWTILCGALEIMIGRPRPLAAWLAGSLVLLPVGWLLGRTVRSSRAPAVALVESVVTLGVTALAAVTYLVVVAGFQGAPRGHERDVLWASLVAGTVVAVLAVPARRWLAAVAGPLVADRDVSAEETVAGFAARMSRAVPMDELLLQLAESLRASVARGGAEVWTGSDGPLTRVVSVPSRPPAGLELGERERAVVAQARVGGAGWASVWLPQLHETAADFRVVPIAHRGQLHGLIVVRRAPDEPAYTEDDERPLVDLARQLGLALHNVRLDSALQASLAELAQRNEELQASRLRIVTAADASRREIERNLHDGAQQHLVALAVKLGLARQLAADGDRTAVVDLLADVHSDTQATIAELRELAHGIYPPLLRDRGLGEALRTAALRCVLPCSVEIQLPGRYPEAVETAAYFCCLEAMQNAGKHAGAEASVTVRVRGDDAALAFEIVDDGVGFDPAATAMGHGFVNMRDRLGTFGAQLAVESAAGHGTTVHATIPARPG